VQYPEKDKASCQRLFRRKAFRLLKFPHQESWNTWCRMHRSTRHALSSGVGNRWGLHTWKTATGGLLTNDIPLTVPHTTLNSPVSADTSERTDLKHGSRTKAQRTSASENAPDRRQTNTHTHTHTKVSCFHGQLLLIAVYGLWLTHTRSVSGSQPALGQNSLPPATPTCTRSRKVTVSAFALVSRGAPAPKPACTSSHWCARD
jgi:hypothetical protein